MLNANNVANAGGIDRTTLPAATYPGRVVQVIDMGLQPQSFDGEDKKPLPEINFTYELSDEFLKDKEGKDIPEKPRWISERMPLHNLKQEKAKSTARYKAFDPAGKFKGSFADVIGAPVLITIGHNPGKGKNQGRVFEKVMAVAAMRDKDAAKLPALVNPSVVFDLDNPNKEVFEKLPEFVQKRIISNLEFAGSKLAALLGESITTLKEPAKALDDDDNPY